MSSPYPNLNQIGQRMFDPGVGGFDVADIKIDNWQAPGEEWWDTVQSKPDEPLIQATIKLTCSWNEYQQLMYLLRTRLVPQGIL